MADEEALRPRVAIIGAGMAGLCAIKTCLDEKFLPICFERRSYIGGLWRYTPETNPEQGPVVHQGLILNTTREMSSFSDFPMPDGTPLYPTHQTFCEYLRSYAVNFDLLRHIRLNHCVTSVHRAPCHQNTGRWLVSYKDESGATQTELYDRVMLCPGLLKHPYTPVIPGAELFRGRQLHSRDYRTPEVFKNKRVLIIGNSHTAGDLCSDACHTSQGHTTVCVGRGTMVIPRLHAGNRSPDMMLSRIAYHVPKPVTSFLFRRMLNARTAHGMLGIPDSGDLFTSPKMISEEIGLLMACGKLRMRRHVVRFDADAAIYDDGTREEVDVVVYATGFTPDYSEVKGVRLLDEDLMPLLYKSVWPLDQSHHTLAVICAVRVNLSSIPPAELQCRWVTSVFSGRLTLPEEPAMREETLRFNRECQGMYGRGKAVRDSGLYTDELADLLGVKPDLFWTLFTDPCLWWRLITGPIFPVQYRMQGMFSWHGAKQRFLQAYNRSVNFNKNNFVTCKDK